MTGISLLIATVLTVALFVGVFVFLIAWLVWPATALRFKPLPPPQIRAVRIERTRSPRRP